MLNSNTGTLDRLEQQFVRLQHQQTKDRIVLKKLEKDFALMQSLLAKGFPNSRKGNLKSPY